MKGVDQVGYEFHVLTRRYDRVGNMAAIPAIGPGFNTR
jgi:hypothetical protein